MSIRFSSSRHRFSEYLAELQHRRQTGRDGPFPSSRLLARGPGRRTRSSADLAWNFFKLLRGQRLTVAFSLATVTVATIFGLLPPAATKLVIDYVLTDNPLPEGLPSWLKLPSDRWVLLQVVVVALVVASIAKVGIHMWGRWYATRATKRIQLSVRKRVFAHAVRLPLDRVQEMKSGGVASILREDSASVGELVFGMLYNPWRAVVQLIGSLLVLAWVDWQLLVGSLILLPLIYITHRTWIGRIRPLYRDVRARREEIDGKTAEAFGGMRVVRAFSRQRSETSRIMRDNHLMGRQELSAWCWARTIEMIWETIIPLATAGLLLYGGAQVLRGSLTMGDLMMFMFYLLMLLEPLSVLATSAAQLQNSLSGLDRILDLLEEPREMPLSPASISVRKSEVRGHIRLENVGFQYPGTSDPALTDISLDVQPGQTVALVGASGAGKTTLCNLVARFYDPTSGRILLDGRDLRQIEVENYRSLLGVVEQDVFLFDGTVVENIGYARRHASDEEIRQAARAANADQFINQLPRGYETIIGERGVKLSGGQRQRIAIARAVLADPRILSLDEATSNLDTQSERLIQRGLKALMRDRTSFVIAHRLSTITHADQIVVLEDGRVSEIGSHRELSREGGKYAQMLQVQIGSQSFAGEPSELPRPLVQGTL